MPKQECRASISKARALLFSDLLSRDGSIGGTESPDEEVAVVGDGADQEALARAGAVVRQEPNVHHLGRSGRRRG
eukprot:scaffold27691_cov81-Isochrysis_galbana.AAC.1